MDFIETCRKFIAIDSTPSNGNLELAEYAAELCRQAGLKVTLQRESLNGIEQANIIARPGESIPANELLLQTHLDTVDPGNYALWVKTNANPFNASIYHDTLYGLGAADVKLDFLCKLRAVQRVMAGGRTSWRLPFVLVGTFGEESGMGGAVKLIRKKMISARRALVGEPTEMRLIHAMKGFASVDILIPFSDEEREFHRRHNLGESTSTQSKMFMGKASHSSDPLSGESAILKMFEYLSRLPDGVVVMEIEGGTNFNTIPAHALLEIDMAAGIKDTITNRIARVLQAITDIEHEFRNYSDPGFTPSTATLNIGMIRTYEDHVKLSGCCRLPPAVTNEIYEGWMRRLRDACETAGAEFRIKDYKQPFRTSLDSDFGRICQEELSRAGLLSEGGAQSSTNEANVFSRFGIECVVIGPGRGVGNSHAPDECVSLAQLDQATDFYQRVIERICI